MSYQKHTWVKNEIIRSKQLNHLEEGIYNEEQRAEEQEELLNQAIADATTRATNRETALASTINTLNVNLTEKINILNGDSTVEGSVDYKIEQAIANAGGYKITLDHTAETNPSTKYIYLEEDSTATGSDKFEEWIWYYDESTDTYSWRMIGEVSLDLSAYALKSEIPTKTSDLTNDTNFITDSSYVHTDNNYTSTEKSKLSGIASGAEVNVQSDWNETDSTSDAYIANKPTIPSGVTVDSALSSTSENPVQNKVINTALGEKANTSDLATVATSGSYSDLTNKPTIPTVDSALSTSSTNPVQNKVITAESRIKTWIGTCATAAATQAKVATVDSGFTLTKGVRIGIKYTYSNTFSATSSAPITLNVNGTGAKQIYYNNTATPTGTNTTAFGYANRYTYYVYDGTYWVWDGMGTESDTRDFRMGTSRSGASANILYFVYS